MGHRHPPGYPGGVERDNPVQGVEFFRVKIVFGHLHVLLPWLHTDKRGQTHVGGGRVGAQVDNLGGGVTVSCLVHFVLHGGEEALGGLGRGVVIDTGGVDVQHLASEYLLSRSYIPDAGEQFVEVTAPPGLLHALIIQSEPLDQELSQSLPPDQLRGLSKMRSRQVIESLGASPCQKQ